MGDWLRSRLARIAGPRLAGPLVPVVAVMAAFLVGGVMLLMLGANPIEGYGALLDGAFGDADALALSDRIAVMSEGRILAVMDRSEATIQRIGLLMAGSEAAA